MFGPRITTVFRSRWNALFWAGGVLLTAYCSVPSQNDQLDAKQAEQVAALVAATQGHDKAAEYHANPWAKSAD